MARVRVVRLLASSLLFCLPAALSAQSLGEAASQEQRRRESKKPKPARVYTDEDLKRAREAGTAAVTVLGAATGGQASAPAEERSGGESESEGGERAAWRSRAAEQREEIRNLEERIRQLQARIDALALDTDPNPSDLFDPNRLEKREAEKQKALEELARAKENLATAKKGLEDLEEEARLKRIPQGWLEP